jgi:hypothetical protein
MLASALVLATAAVSTAAAPKPVVTVSFAGYDQLMSTMQQVCTLAGKPDLPKGLEGMLILFTQGRGLAGLDKARPWGLVVSAGDDGQFPIHAFVPVTDLTKLMSLAPDPKTRKPMAPDADGVYELSGGRGQTFYVAQKGKWAFIVNDKTALASVPTDPSAALGDLSKKYLVAVRGSVKNLPAQVRDQFLASYKALLGMAFHHGQFGENPEQGAIASNLVNQGFENLSTLAKELDTVLLGLGMDASTGTVYLECDVTARDGTQTAKRFAMAQDAKTNFAGFQIPSAAVSGLSVATLDEAGAAQLKDLLAKGRKIAQKNLAANDNLTDEQKQLAKGLLDDALDVLDKTIEKKTIDRGMALLLEAGAPSLVAGMTIADGAKLNKVVKQLVTEAGKEEPQVAGLIKLDAAKHEDINFHTAAIPIEDEVAAAVLGRQLDLVVGIGSDALYFGAGKNALATLKKAIDDSKQNAGKSVPPARVVVSAGAIAKFIAQVAPDDEAKTNAGRVSEVLAASAGKDHVILVAEPITDGVHVRLSVEEGILKAILNQVPMGGPAPGGSKLKSRPVAKPAGDDPF